MRFIRTLLGVSFALASASSLSSALAQGMAPAGPPGAPPPQPQPVADADAPGVHTHDGFHLRLGLGYGYMTTSVDPGSGTIKGPGSAWQLTIGGTPVPGLVIGGTLFTHIQGKPTVEQGNISGESSKAVFLLGIGPTADFYPDPKGGLHFGGSLLYTTLNSVNYTSTGFGVGVFGGYDFWIGKQWSLGPTLQLVFSKSSKDPEKDTTTSIAAMITLLDH